MKKSMILMKFCKGILLVAGVFFLVTTAANLLRSAGAAKDESIFETAEIVRGDLAITVSSTGSLAAQGTVEVGTQVSGTIESVHVDYNDCVKKGQELARLDQSLFQAEVQEARAKVASARAQWQKAQADLNRNKTLHEKDYISDEEFLAFQTSLDLAQADLQSANAALKRSEINLDYTIIRSPIDGTVIERSIEEGQTVAASLSTPTLFIIAEDLAQMQIEVDVDESDIGQVKVGQATEFEVAAYPDRKFTGLVEQIRLQPQTISNVVTYTVVVESQNEDGVLLPGMTATVDFMVNRQQDALLVPDSALKFSLGKRNYQGSGGSEDHGWIYVLGNDQPPQRIQVQKGLSDGSSTVISGENIEEGMRVITSANSDARENKRGLFSKLMPGPPGSRRGGGTK